MTENLRSRRTLALALIVKTQRSGLRRPKATRLANAEAAESVDWNAGGDWIAEARSPSSETSGDRSPTCRRCRGDGPGVREHAPKFTCLDLTHFASGLDLTIDTTRARENREIAATQCLDVWVCVGWRCSSKRRR